MGVNQKRGLVLVLAIIMVIGTIPVGFSNGVVAYYVDSVSGDDANNGSSGAPFASLMHALTQVTAVGGSYEIHLAAGYYANVGAMQLPSGVSLRILGQGDATVLYKPSPEPDAVYVYSRNVAYLSFEDMIIQADDPTTDFVETGVHGIYIYDNDFGGSSMLVDSCEIDGFQFGIFQEHSDGFSVNVTHSEINGIRPIHMNNGVGLNVTYSNLHMSSGEWSNAAIYLGGSGALSVISSTIRGNNGVGRGIYGGFGSANISQTTFRDLSVAVELGDFGRIDLIENTVYTTEDGFDIEQYVNGDGIRIVDNTLVNNGYWQNGDVGIEIDVDDNVDAANIEVTGNTIANFHLAFDLGTDDENTVNFDFSGNLFRNNYRNLVLSTYMATPFDFTLNDWGTDDLAEIQAMAYSSSGATVDVFDFDPIVPTVAPSVVTVGSGPSDDYDSIQEGMVWVANGGTVNIGNGVYSGPIWVGRPMSLVGVGDSVVVNKHPSMSFVQDTILYATADVHLENLMFSAGEHAIYMEELGGVDPGNLTVRDCTFDDLSQAAIRYLIQNPDTSSSIVVEGNTFDRDVDGGYAMLLHAQGNDVRIEGNSIDDGYSLFAFVDARDVSMVDNAVSFIRRFGVSAVYINASGEVVVDGNTFVAPAGIPSDNLYNGLVIDLPAIGVDVSSDGIHHVITGNIVSGFNRGLNLSGNQTSDTYDVVVGGSELNANDFSGNTLGFVSDFYPFGHESGAAVDARYNYWGVPSESLPSYLWVASTSSGYGPAIYLPVLEDAPAVLTSISVTPVGGVPVGLSPSFDSAVTSYTASVQHSVSSVSLNAVASEGVVTLRYGALTDVALPATVSLAVGANVFEFVLENESVETIYTVTVTRAAAPPVGPPPSDDDDTPSVVGPVVVVPPASGSRITVDMVNEDDSGLFVYEDDDSSEDRFEVAIEGAALEDLAGRSGARLVLEAPLGEISFDSRAISRIVRDFGVGSEEGLESSDDFEFVAERLEPVNGRPTFAFTLERGGDLVSDFGGGTVTVRVPYVLAAGEDPHAIIVYHLDASGVRRAVHGYYEDGFVVMRLKHFSTYVIDYNAVDFVDVDAKAEYSEAVRYFASRGVVNGFGASEFKPDRAISRAQMIMVIMKALGVDWSAISDEALADLSIALDGSKVSNFADAGNTYYTRALWVARAMRLVNGRSGERFDPEATVSANEAYLMIRNACLVLEPDMAVDAGLFGESGVFAKYVGDRSLLTRGDALMLLYFVR